MLETFWGRWGRMTAVLAGGGMIFAFATLVVVRLLARLFAGGTLLTSSTPGVFALVAGVAAAGLITYALLRRLGWRKAATRAALAVWGAGYGALWLLGALMGGLSLPLYLVLWLLIGAGGTLLWARMAPGDEPAIEDDDVAIEDDEAQWEPRERPAYPQFAGTRPGGMTVRMDQARDTQAVIRRSDYGRIPVVTLNVITRQVGTVTNQVIRALPQGTPREVRNTTIRLLLRVTLRDWWENGNTEGLPSQDVADLHSFVRCAAAIAQDLATPDGAAIYQVVLAALLDDWLQNWNVNGVDGPRRRG